MTNKTVFTVLNDDVIYYFDNLGDLADFLVQIQDAADEADSVPALVIETRVLTEEQWEELPQIDLNNI